MSFATALGWMVCIISLVGIWLTGSKKRSGFALGAANQILWVLLGYLKGIPAFYPMATIFFLIYLRGFFAWKRPAVLDAPIDIRRQTLLIDVLPLMPPHYGSDPTRPQGIRVCGDTCPRCKIENLLDEARS